MGMIVTKRFRCEEGRTNGTGRMTTMRKRLGMITPSSNSVLEPVTSAMMAEVAGITAHFSRFRVTEIGLDAAASNQFDASVMLPAADLLADAKVDAIVAGKPMDRDRLTSSAQLMREVCRNHRE